MKCYPPRHNVSKAFKHQELLPSLCKDLGIVIYLVKLDLEYANKAQYLGMLIDTIWDSVYWTDS